MYKILFYIWYAIAKLPPCVHYFNATWLSAVLFHVIRYRRKLVHKNIKDSFPELSHAERWKIERRFYLHFCDILVESIMYMAISEKQIRRRMQFIGAEQMSESARRGKMVGLYLGHYANWEWVSSIPLWLDLDVVTVAQLYHPLENKVFDRLVGYTRQRFGGKNIPVNESLRHIVGYRKQGRPLAVGFIADQVPMWNNIHHWLPFLNHPETPVFTGSERLMRQLDMDVYYLDVRQVRRGYYIATVQLMTTTPKQCPEYWLTNEYSRLLEQTIRTSPALWLWSHNRWKRTKAEWQRLMQR